MLALWFKVEKILGNRVAFLILLILTIFVARLATWFFPLDSDHWIFFEVGSEWFDGKILYLEIWDHKPPIIFFINGLMSLFLGDFLIWHRVFFTFWMLIELGLAYVLFKKIIAKLKPGQEVLWSRIGIISYAFWRNLSQFTSSGNNTENFGLLFLVGMYLAYWNFKEKKNLWWLLLSGANLSIMIFLKPNFVLLSLPIWLDFLIWFVGGLLKKVTPSFEKLEAWQPLLFGIVFLIPVFVQAGFWFWYFANQNALWNFWFGFYEFSANYLGSTWQGAVSEQLIFILISLPFYILFVIFLGLFCWQKRKKLWAEPSRFILFSGVAGLIFILILGSFYPYYYLILIPILVLLAVSLDWTKLNRWMLLFLVLLIIGMSGLSYVFSMRQFYNSFSGPVAAEEQELQEVADHVSDKVGSDEPIYAYVYGATFYHLTDREPASNYISGNVLILDYREDYGYDLNRVVINDLEKNQPELVILYEQNDIYEANEELMSYLNSCYLPDKSWTNYRVLERVGCQVEPSLKTE